MKIESDLYDLFQEFIEENNIINEEVIEELDPHVITELLKEICDLIGYHNEPHNLEDDYWE